MESKINPFDSQETKPYKNDAEVIAMTNLVGAYQRKDILQFEKILKDNKSGLMDDEFISQYMSRISVNIQSAVLVQMITPYTRISLDFLADVLKVHVDHVRDLLVTLILDEKIKGKIDGIQGILVLQASGGGMDDFYKAVGKWSDNGRSLFKTVIARV